MAQEPRQPAAVDETARRRAVSGFALQDIANSAFVTVVVTAVGGPFLTALANDAARADGRLPLGPLAPRADAVFAYAVTASVLVQVLLLPLLGALADRSGSKRRLLAVATAIGAAATVVLAVVPSRAVLLGLLAFVVANVAFGAAILAYNAYLADVAALPDRDRVSSLGYAWGYAGGGFVLALGLVLVLLADRLGLSRAGAVRIAIGLSALWWAGFGAVSLRRLDAARLLPWHHTDEDALLTDRVGGSLRSLRDALSALRALPGTARYLLAFLLFNDAIQAVIALSSVVLQNELFVAKGRPADDATPFLLQLILLIQIVAIAGAGLASRLAARFGAKSVVLATLVVWALIVSYAVFSLDSTVQAYGLGIAIALVLGGSQSLARSLFSSMTPHARQASFFGFYELAERGTAWIGTLIFAVVLDVTDSYRGAFASLLVLFVAGGLLLAATDTDAAITAAHETDVREEAR